MAISDKNSIEDELNDAIEELQRDEPQPARKPAGSKPNIDLIMGIPVDVQVVLGSTSMPVANLMKLGRGSVVTLDKQIGDPVDIVVNGRVIARGEVIVLEDDSSRFGVSLTEVIGSGH
ncbi:flagellar motor switch protein FliN [Phyllobacterium sp. K27]